MPVTQKLFKILSGHDVANGRTDRRTDRQTDGRADAGFYGVNLNMSLFSDVHCTYLDINYC